MKQRRRQNHAQIQPFCCLVLPRSLSNFVYLLSKIATSFWAFCLVSQQSQLKLSQQVTLELEGGKERMMKMYWPAKVRDLHGWCPNRALGRENVNTSITHFGQPHHCERWTLSICRGEEHFTSRPNITHCSKSSFFVQKFNFDLPRKLSIFWVKNSWKCCGFGHLSCWQLWFHEKNWQKKNWVKNS